MPANDVTLQGVWELDAESVKSYDVTYEFVSGTAGEALPSEGMPAAPAKAEGVKYGADVTLPTPDPASVEDARGTWVFKGWRVSGTDQILESYEMPANDVTLQGVWELRSLARYGIVYSYAGEVPTNIKPAPVVEGTFEYGSEQSVATEPYEIGDTITDASGTWTFSGWDATSSGVVVVNGKFIMPANNVAFTGSWDLTTVDISGQQVTVDYPENVPYDGTEHTWIPTVTDADGNVLVANRDYTVRYSTSDHTNVSGRIRVTITGIGNYAGSVERTYSITPLQLIVTADDITKYVGEADPALTSTYRGVLEGEVPGWSGSIAREPGEAVGTYAIDLNTLSLEDNPEGNFRARNYQLIFEIGTFTILDTPTTPDDGGDDTPTTPTTPTTPGDDGTGAAPNPTPAPGGTVTPADVADDAADDATTDDATSEETVTDDENPLASGDEEGIEDNGNPLASGRGDEDCWVHWLILVGMILTAVYFVGVAVRRRKFTADLLDYEDKVLGNNRNDA